MTFCGHWECPITMLVIRKCIGLPHLHMEFTHTVHLLRYNFYLFMPLMSPNNELRYKIWLQVFKKSVCRAIFRQFYSKQNLEFVTKNKILKSCVIYITQIKNTNYLVNNTILTKLIHWIYIFVRIICGMK